MRYANTLESYVLNPLSVDDVSEYKRNYRKEESLIALKKKFACRIASFVSIASLVTGLYFIGDDIRFSFESLMLIIFAPVLSFLFIWHILKGLVKYSENPIQSGLVAWNTSQAWNPSKKLRLIQKDLNHLSYLRL